MTEVSTQLLRDWPARIALPGWSRLVVALSLAGAALILIATHSLVTSRETERVRKAAAEQAAMFSTTLLLEVQRAAPLPVLAARDPSVVQALLDREATATGPHGGMPPGEAGAAATSLLERLRRKTGVAGLMLHDALAMPVVVTGGADGRGDAVRGVVEQALRLGGGSFVGPGPDGAASIWFAEPVRQDARTLGVVVLRMRIEALVEAWRRAAGEVVVTDAAGAVIASTLPGRVPARAGGPISEPGAAGAADAGREVAGWAAPADHIAAAADVGVLGLRLHHFAPMETVRERVRGVLSVEIMLMSLATALVLFTNSRRTLRAYQELQTESDALRELNARLRDEIAERRRVEAELREAEAGLAQASKLAALGEMSAAVSHELNQPLAAMKTWLAGARLLIDRGRAAEAGESLDRIDGLIGRMASITRQLKAFARKGGEELQPFDLRDAAKGAVALVAAQVEAAGARLVTDTGGVAVHVKGDQLRLEQIVVNLLRNALDAVAAAGEKRIELTVRRRGAVAEVTVEDTGAGLPAGLEGQLFEPFFTTKKAGDGLGLGLAISAGIASDLGGRIVAERRPSGGARFVLTLPVAARP